MSAPSPKITLYTASWCPSCRPAIEFLDRHGLDYASIDIEEHPEAAEELENATGKRGIPFLKVDDAWVQAYTPGGGPFPKEALERALGLATS